MGADIGVTRADVERWVTNGKIADEVVKSSMQNPETYEELAGDIAEEISDYLEDDPTFRKRLMDAALKNADFKKRLVSTIVKELND